MLLQICRVEDVIVEGSINGSVVHFHWVRTIVVHPSGVISASGLGMASAFLVLNLFLNFVIIMKPPSSWVFEEVNKTNLYNEA